MAIVTKTPGVYIEEISIFPPSIAQVETAVPAFIGYTEFAKNKGESLLFAPTRLRSLVEYEQLFGAAPEVNVDSIVLDANNNVKSAALKSSFLLYDSLRLFFSNGGSKCYIISIGAYGKDGNGVPNVQFPDFEKGLAALRTQDEPTLIVFPDATLLPDHKLYILQQEALAQAAALGDRFVLCDLYGITDDRSFDETVQEFRDNIGIQNLPYGAAYAPHLKTNLEKKVTYRMIQDTVRRDGSPDALEITSLATSDTPKTALEILEKSIDDVDKYRTAADAFLAGKNTSGIEAGYLSLLDDFKAKLAAHGTASDGPTTQLRGSYRALIDYAYDSLDALADAPLAAGFFGSVSGDAAKAIYLEDDLEKAASKDGTLNSYLLELNRLTRNAHDFVGGDASDGGSNLGDRYKSKAAAFTATAWGNIFEDATVDAQPLDYTPYPNAIPAGAEASRQARRDNLASGEKFLTILFKKIAAALTSLSSAAGDLEATYEKAALSLFPKAQEIIDRVKNTVAELPPSAAIAGVYTSVDAARGVHKAPANVSLASVVGVAELITHEEQADLNVDVVAGKSINAIRPFTGKGILVWGARTLAGNDNEWRYVSVRRFFNMVEESTKKATERFVFEPNDANTWVKVKTMIENFLINQWRAGALAGSTPEKAFFVKVGLGQTMTPQDILEGIMIVEIGMAAVRPAEFIILRFSHKMQEA
jgi:phage tail sheath protein FI